MTKSRKTLLISEKPTLFDLIFKYTIRDFFLGILSPIPATIGIVLRMFTYRFLLKRCGKGLFVKEYVTFRFPERIEIGDYVGINEFSCIDGDGGLEIGDYTRISTHVSILSHSLSYEDSEIPIKMQKKIKKRVVIGRDVWIGSGARIFPGIKIGHGSVIGAGSVVTKDIPPYSVAVGIPAKVIKKRGAE